jgi:hypothetical protein
MLNESQSCEFGKFQESAKDAERKVLEFLVEIKGID